MNLKEKEYDKIKDSIQSGDVIAFSGRKLTSHVIRRVTKGNVSHVGIIVPPKFLDDSHNHIVLAEAIDKGVTFVPLIDKVKDKGVEKLWWLRCSPKRVDPVAFKDFIEKHKDKDYDYQQAAMLILDYLESALDEIGPQLNQSVREILLDMIVPRLTQTISEKLPIVDSDISDLLIRGTLSEVINEHIDLSTIGDSLLDLISNQEDPSKFFCSEFVAGALETGGVTGKINTSRITPIKLCQMNIYDDNYFQFKGDLEEIDRFNSESPQRG